MSALQKYKQEVRRLTEENERDRTIMTSKVVSEKDGLVTTMSGSLYRLVGPSREELEELERADKLLDDWFAD